MTAAFECPHCNAYSTFEVVFRDNGLQRLQSRIDGSVRDFLHGAIRCSNPRCRRVLGALLDLSGRDEAIAWWPTHVGGRTFPDVPEHIAATADEAFRCQTIGAYRGAVALARSVIEAAAKDLGVTKGNLVAKIDEMQRQGLIRAVVADCAHEVRYLGNEVAHGDFAAAMAAEEAEEALGLMCEVLNDAYQQRARVARLRAAREQRTSAPVAGSVTDTL